MADILQPTDQFLVNRSDSTKTVTTEDLMAELQDTDLMLVNRGGTTYTITGEDVKDSLNPGPGPISFTPTITGDNKVGDVLTASAGAITGGVAPIEYAFQWKRDGDDISSATAKTYTLVNADVGQTISCDVTCAEPDGSGAVTETAVYGLTPIDPDRAPVIGSVGLVELNPDNAPRFTDQSFETTVVMDDQGFPQSTKEFQAKVEGTITTTANFERRPTTVNNENASGTATITAGGPIEQGSVDPTWFGTTDISYDDYQWFSYVPNYLHGGNIGWTYETTGIINSNGSDIIYLLYAIELASTSAGGDTCYAEIYYTDGTSTYSQQGTTLRVPDGMINAAAIEFNGGIDSTKTINKVRFQWNNMASSINLKIRFYGFNFTGVTNKKVTSASTDYTDVVFDSSDQFNLLEVGDVVTQSGVNFNPIQSIDEAANTFIIPGPNQNVSTSVPIIGPEKTVVVENATKYLDFNTAGTVTSLLDAPMNPPVSLPDENPQLTLTFPSTFPSGETPDQELGDGTTLTVDVKAVSNGFQDEESSNTVQPSNYAPLPPGALSGQTVTYAGTESDQLVQTGIDLVNGAGMIWIKNRTAVANPVIVDTVRGSNKTFYSNNDEKENDKPTWVKSFDTTGFTLGNNTVAVNNNGNNFVAWTFTVSGGYFDVVKYTGNSDANQTVAHSLGSAPGCIILKNRDEAGDWYVYHIETGEQNVAKLNKNNEFYSAGFDVWTPTDSSFNAAAYNAANNAGDEYVAYLFGNQPGLIKCGGYDTAGTNYTSQTITTGFEPQWVMVKCSSYTGDWYIFDAKRPGTFVVANGQGGDAVGGVTFESNGFTYPYNSPISGNSEFFIYIAIAAPVVRSLTEAEFAQQRLNFETYKNRKEVKCGEDALAARQALIDKLREQGYTDAEIDAELGIT